MQKLHIASSLNLSHTHMMLYMHQHASGENLKNVTHLLSFFKKMGRNKQAYCTGMLEKNLKNVTQAH